MDIQCIKRIRYLRMDTDDLSEEAFEVIRKAYDVSHFLKTNLGALSRLYKNEEEYLKGMDGFIKNIISDPMSFQDEWLLEEPLEHKKLLQIEKYILEVISIPLKKRTYLNY